MEKKVRATYLRQGKVFFAMILLFFSTTLFAQRVEISGRVTGEDNKPLPGVNVFLKSSKTGTITNLTGDYRIFGSREDTIVFSFVGYGIHEARIGNQQVINVTLMPAAETLEAVVVVGYGVQKKESVVGAISQAKGDEIVRMNMPDLTNSLTGLVPGLVTVQTTGVPGGESAEDKSTKIYIRGLSTWNGGGPLTLVDGIERSILDVEPNEIESISVLKDASATAVFGVKGANGVILVTTKRGKSNKPQINIEAQTTLSQISRVYTPLNSYDANYLKNLAIINELNVSQAGWASFVPDEILGYYKNQTYPELYPDVNWYEEMTRDFAKAHKMNLNIVGGSERVSYFSSLSYLHEDDILKGEDLGQGYVPGYRYDRFNVRSNIDFKLSRTTKLSVNLAAIYGAREEPNSDKKSLWRGVYGNPPDIYPIRYSDGVYAEWDGFQFPNSFKVLNFSGQKNENRSQLNSDITFDQKLDFITEGLSFNTKVSVDNSFETIGPRSSAMKMATKYILPTILEVPEGEDLSPYTVWTYPTTGSNGYNFVEDPVTFSPESISGAYRRQLFYQFSLNYTRSFGNHNFTGLALMNRTERATGSDFLSKREDWVSRITYDYANRYFLEFNGAYNGSEKFSEEYRFGFFPSFAAGWLLSNETFFKEQLPFINLMRFRYSNGRVGSDAGIDRWLYLEDWDYFATQWKFGKPYLQSSGYPIYMEGTIANPFARWETAIKNNFGIETAAFSNRIRFNFDYFWEHRIDMLINAKERTSNAIYGDDLPSANIGEVKTRGYETELLLNYTTASRWNINSRITYNYATDIILERDDPPLMPDYQKLAGHQIGQTINYLNGTIIQNWDQMYRTVQWDNRANSLPGDMSYVDYNADGKIDVNDKVPIGYPQRPQHSYSFNLGSSYKGFRASVMFYGVYNIHRSLGWTEFPQSYTIVYPLHQNSWSPENGITADATSRGLRYLTLTNQISEGSQELMDASYLRLQNAELAYEFSKDNKWLGSLGLSKLSVYVRGNNLYVWTKMYEDRDANGESNGDGTGNRSYPLMRRYTLGVVFGF
jgi:TonB-linked SusC/RagA family outer membrane protein